MRARSSPIVVGIFFAVQLSLSQVALATSISLALQDPYTAEHFTPGAQQDFWRAVAADSDISTILPDIHSIHIGSDFFKYASVSEVSSLLDWIRASHLELTLQTGILPVTGSSGCGWGVEGYDGMFENHLQRVKNLGGTISVLDLDEPLFFGSEWSGTNACHSPIARVAAQTLAAIDEAKAIFPGIKVVDTEPVPYTTNYGTWLADLNSLQAGTLNEFDADIVWPADWMAPLGETYEEAANYDLQTGAIIDGDAEQTGSCAWTTAATSNLNTLRSTGTLPSNLVVASWDNVPTNIGPPSTPCTLSSVAAYVAAEPSMPVPEPSQLSILFSMGAALALSLLLRGHLTGRQKK